jgi:glycopeptide antibiotics resistance protein
MLKFLNSFSAPLIGSLSFWPFLCILLTIPFIISRLIMRRRVTWSYVFFSYGSILYFTGLIFFALSPVPKDPIAFCQTYHIQPQLIPFNWVNDVVQPNKDTLYITLQLIMNIVFFVPLGIFMKAYFHKHWKFALLSGFLLSMLIEVTQLTGVFGLCPCSYRLDVICLAKGNRVFWYWR